MFNNIQNELEEFLTASFHYKHEQFEKAKELSFQIHDLLNQSTKDGGVQIIAISVILHAFLSSHLLNQEVSQDLH